MKNRRALSPAVIALAVLIAGSCSFGPGPPDSSFGREAPGDSIRIFVTNLNFMDATLWALTTGTREKLGVVTGKRNAVYMIPWRGYTDLSIEIDLLSGPRCVTESLPVGPGEDIELIIDVEMLNGPRCRRPRE